MTDSILINIINISWIAFLIGIAIPGFILLAIGTWSMLIEAIEELWDKFRGEE